MRKAVIKLYIDPTTYRAECGEDLTDAKLQEIAADVNQDAAPIYGYESWIATFEDIDPTH